MGYFFFTICVSWLMPGDWMSTNHVFCQHKYKKKASELKYTNWQYLLVESLGVWTSGVKQSAGKIGSRPFIPPINFFLPLREAQLVGVNNGRIWNTGHMAAFFLSKKRNVMKHDESLGRNTEIAKIGSLTHFIFVFFVNWLKKSKDLPPPTPVPPLHPKLLCFVKLVDRLGFNKLERIHSLGAMKSKVSKGFWPSVSW